MAAACIIPDKDIVVIIDDCGEEWVASTPGAIGYNGLGVEKYIQTNDEHWIVKTYCVPPAKGNQLEDSGRIHHTVLEQRLGVVRSERK